MHPSYFSSSHTFQLTHMPAKMATDAYSVPVQHSIPMEMPANDYESFYDNNNNGYLKQFNDDLDVIDEFIKEKLEEEFPSMTARTTSCEQHMGNTYVAPPTQNPELELTENLSWFENTMNFQQMRNELVQTVPVQVEMSAIRFESPQHYQYTDLNNFLFQTGKFEAFGNIQILANQGNGLTNVAPANVYYTNFGNDSTTYENFRHHYVPSPETSDFDDTETVSPISQESISEVSDTEDCPSYCRWSNCRQGFSSLAKLGKHLKESHVKTIKQNNFVCSWEVCSQRLSSCYKLLAHLRTHTGEKPYKCIISGCNKAFTAAEGLKIHKRSHTGDKPCICKFCNKAYTNSSDCKKHQRTHIDTRPYACEIIGCPKRYTDPSSLRKHKKQHSAEELEQLPPKRRGRSYRATH